MKLHKIVLLIGLSVGAALGALATATPSGAADQPLYLKAQPPQAEVFSWNGFYVLGNVGYSYGDVDFAGAFTVEPRGMSAGAGIGYNFHLTRNIFLGIEADANWTGLDQALGVAPGISISSELDYYGTVRGKLGYSFGTWNLYATGGWAWGHLASNIGGIGLSADDFVNGWAYGAGAEFALTRSLSLGVEWLRLDYRTANLDFGPGSVPADAQIDTVKAVLRYRWGG